MNGFCVECGKETDRTVRGLCFECFLKDRTLITLPDHVDLQVCTNCGEFLWHGEWQSMDLAKAAASAARENLVCIKEGKVVSAEDHPNADKLFKLQVDIGEETPRTICAGLKAYYTKEQMLGRKAIVVANLAPRPLRGVESCGMLLAADDEDLGGESVLLLRPSDPDIPVGTRFGCGLGFAPADVIDYKKHFSAVTMKVSSVKDGVFVSENIGIELPSGAPGRVAAVVDGGKAVVLGDGKGCVATVDGDIKDGAGVR